MFTPTLPGLGESVHLLSPEIYLPGDPCPGRDGGAGMRGLARRGAGRTQQCRDGGERAAERLVHLVCLDAFVPEDNPSLAGMGRSR